MNTIFSLCLLALCCVFPGKFLTAENSMTILLTSESALKAEAAYIAFSEIFPDTEIHIISSNSYSSGVAAQPVTRDSGVKGVYNRMNSATATQEASVDYIVSIENFIESTNGQEGKVIWKDTAAVLIKDTKNNSESLGFSQSVSIPESYVEKAKSSSRQIDLTGFDVTVGEMIAKENKGIDAKDWHSHKNFGGISRKAILANSIFKTFHAIDLAYVKSKIENHADFPKPGILFQDYFPIMNDPKAFRICIDLLAKRYQHKKIEAIVGLESRGFILGAALAYKMNIPFVPVRKPGKLPGKIFSVSYEKEYGTDVVEISQTALTKKQRVLIIDDLIATGGSAKAAIELVSQTQAEVVEFVTLLEIAELEGRKKIGVPSFNLLDTNG